MSHAMNNDKMHNAAMTTLAGLALAASATAVLPGCRGDREDQPPRQFFPDLDDQLKWKPQTKSDFYADGRTMRPEVKGSVPFSRIAFDPAALGMNTPAEDRPAWSTRLLKERDDFLAADETFYTGKAADGTFVAKIPAKFDLALVERGRLKFNINCSVCHGYLGDGKGTVGSQWSYPVPTFHDDKYKKPNPADPKAYQHLDGYLFHTIRYGVPETSAEKVGQYKMPPYAYQVNESDAWAIVSYIRALQLSRDAGAGDVPPEKVRDLENMRRPSTAPAAAAPTAPATPSTTKPGGRP